MKILICDDSDTNLTLLQRITAKVADDVTVAAFMDPLLAADNCIGHLPDLAIIDYMMPEMNGHELLTLIRSLPGGRDVPVVMITAAEERSVRQKALELGATDFLSKPVDPLEVRVRLSNLLAIRRSHVKLADRSQWLVEEVRNATRTIREREHELIIRLSKAAEFRDADTGAHLQRMARYSQFIARQLGLPTEVCEMILIAAPMHDLGKLGIPDAILLKSGRLDAQEFAVMKRHPTIGHDILDGSESLVIRMGAEIALAHHEKWDGSGYPNGLAGEAIPLTGRIVAVADVFDALTSGRPYKEAWSPDRARAFMEENAGTHFDPTCVDAFFRAWEEVLIVMNALADPIDDGPGKIEQVLA